jgi:predicted PurR-regulated permease PerM
MANQETAPDFLLCFSRGFLWRLLGSVALILVVFYLGNIILVISAGVLLAVVLRAVVNWTRRTTRLSERWSYVLVLFTISALLAGLVFWLGPRFMTQAHQIVKVAPQSLETLQAELDRYPWGRDTVRAVRSGTLTQRVAGRLSTYAGSLFDLVTVLVEVVVLALFMASNPVLYRNGALQLVPEKHRLQAAQLLDQVARTTRWWLIGQLVPMSVLGIGTMIGLWILGVPLAFALALITALMLFIPYVGSVLAYLPAALVALMQGPRQLISVTALYVGIHIAEGYVITPLSQRRAVRLPPALTIVAQLLLWTLAGLLGLIVATPLAAIALVTVQKLYLKKPNGG